MIYEFNGPGAPKGYTAQQVGTELSRIYQTRGALTPASVVDEARDPTAVLHNAFEWDDETAAENYRQAQARQVIRSVVLVSEPEKGEQAPIVRAFVSLSDPAAGERARTYKPVIEAMRDPMSADEVKRRLRHELLALRRRYLDVLDLEQMLDVAHEVMAVA